MKNCVRQNQKHMVNSKAEKLRVAVAAGVTNGFFPQFNSTIQTNLVRLLYPCYGAAQFVAQARALLLNSGYEPPENSHGTCVDLSGEGWLRLFGDTVSALMLNSEYWIAGMDADLLLEFPAQAMVPVIPDAREIVDWSRHWPSSGGKLYGGRMLALKWDPVWLNISAFGLPFPPFQVGSGYDIEDIDADEATTLGLKVPPGVSVRVGIDIDVAALASHVRANLAFYAASFPP